MFNSLYKYALGFGLFIVACVCIAMPVLACSCARPNEQSAQNQYDRAAVVGEFKIVPADNPDMESEYLKYTTLVPVTLYKDGKDETIEQGLSIVVQYNPITSACGHIFESGKNYVLGLEINNGKLHETKYRVMNSCAQYGIRFHVKNKFNI